MSAMRNKYEKFESTNSWFNFIKYFALLYYLPTQINKIQIEVQGFEN